MVIEFFVPGHPAPQGSMRAARNGRMFSDNKRTAPWRRDVARFAKLAASIARLEEPCAGPCEVDLTFLMPAPSYVAKRIALSAGLVGRIPCCVRPDVDKLQRACFDAITDIVWVDDQQVYHVTARKMYPLRGEQPGARVRVNFPEEDR